MSKKTSFKDWVHSSKPDADTIRSYVKKIAKKANCSDRTVFRDMYDNWLPSRDRIIFYKKLTNGQINEQSWF